jgi:hypothetical protein
MGKAQLQIDYGVRLDADGRDGVVTFGQRYLGLRLSALDSHSLAWIYEVLASWQVPEIFLAPVRAWGIQNLTGHRVKIGPESKETGVLADWIKERRAGWTDATDVETKEDFDWFDDLSKPKTPQFVEFSDGFRVEE